MCGVGGHCSDDRVNVSCLRLEPWHMHCLLQALCPVPGAVVDIPVVCTVGEGSLVRQAIVSVSESSAKCNN